jgi:hypothetical protein
LGERFAQKRLSTNHPIPFIHSIKQSNKTRSSIMTTLLTNPIERPSSCQLRTQTSGKKPVLRWYPSMQPVKTACKWRSDLLQADGDQVPPAPWVPRAHAVQPGSVQGPQDTWIDIEDMWLRLRAHCTLKLSCQCGIYELIFVGLETAPLNGQLSPLRQLASDLNTYAWQAGEHRGKFVQCIEYRGTDLMLQVKPVAHIERWPDGEDMASQVKSFMLRLPRMGQPS